MIRSYSTCKPQKEVSALLFAVMFTKIGKQKKKGKRQNTAWAALSVFSLLFLYFFLVECGHEIRGTHGKKSAGVNKNITSNIKTHSNKTLHEKFIFLDNCEATSAPLSKDRKCVGHIKQTQ